MPRTMDDPDLAAFRRIGEEPTEAEAAPADAVPVKRGPGRPRKTPPVARVQKAEAAVEPVVPPIPPAPDPATSAIVGAFTALEQKFSAGLKDLQPAKGRQWNQKTPYNPEGLAEGHRPKVRARCFLNGIPCLDDIMTPDEIAAWNAAQAGERTIRKSDGSMTKVTLTDKAKLDGTVEARHLVLDVTGDLRHNWIPLTDILAAFAP